MPRALPQDFDWRTSPGHLYLLGYFRRPASPRHITGMSKWNYLDLGESADAALHRLRSAAALVPCSLEDKLEVLYRQPDLKELLKQRGLKVSGSKSEQVRRLLDADRGAMEAMTAKEEVVQTSASAETLLDQYLATEQARVDASKQRSLDALRARDFRGACRAVVDFHRQPVYFKEVGGSDFASSYDASHDLEQLSFIFAANPDALADLSEQDLEALRVAAAMHTLWHDPIDKWLSPTSASTLPNSETAGELLLYGARFNQDKERLSDFPPKELRLERFRGPGICDRCDAVLQHTYKNVDELPNLPLEGCESSRGCEIHIRPVYDWDNEAVGELTFEIDDGSSGYSRLAELKRMLDAELISPEEYETKKAEILKEL